MHLSEGPRQHDSNDQNNSVNSKCHYQESANLYPLSHFVILMPQPFLFMTQYGRSGVDINKDQDPLIQGCNAREKSSSENQILRAM